MKNQFKIMFKSSRFVIGLVLILVVLIFAILYPFINTNDPKLNRYINPDYEATEKLQIALKEKNYEIVQEEFIKLKKNEDPEIMAMMEKLEPYMETLSDENIKEAYKTARDIKKTIKHLKDQPPSSKEILGTDNFGADMLLKLAHGTRTSLFVGVIAGICATIVGLIVGLFAGFVGGRTDDILNTMTNMFIVIPSFIILILISVALGSTPTFATGIIIGLTSWPWTARAVRAQTISLRNRDHVSMARITGYSTPHIIASEILPYIASYVVMAFILQVASGIMSEATLSMLGLGDPTAISLGKLLNWAIQFEAVRSGRWWQFIPVALTITAVTFGLYLMNSGMDEVFNPKIRS